MKKLVLVDGNALLFRAYYATAATGAYLKSKSGIPTNALFGFISMFEKMLELTQPDHLLVAFDAGKKTFRHEEFEAYKGGRRETPEDLIAQFSLVQDYLDVHNVAVYKIQGYEADDIIGTVSKMAEKENFKVEIFTSDRDLLQLISDQTTVCLTKKGLTEIERNDPQMIKDKYNLTPMQIIDLKGLMGDASDNIPGIPGVGEKTALKLLDTYGSVENVIANRDELKGKLKERVEEHQELALMSKRIATIFRDVPVDLVVDDLDYTGYDVEAMIDFYRQYDLNALVRKLDGLKKTSEDETIVDVVSKMPVIMGPSALYLSVMGDNYHRSTILGFGVYNDKQTLFISYEDALKDTLFLDWLKSDQIKWGYDIKQQMVAAHWNQIEMNGFEFDLKLASYILDPSIKDDFKSVCEFYGYDDVSFDENIYGKGAKIAVPEVNVLANHVCKQAMAIYKLKDDALTKLKEENQLELYTDIELPLASILMQMELQGIKVDQQILIDQGLSLMSRIKDMEIQIYDYAGVKFNISSPKQLGDVLFETMNLPSGKKTKTGYSTSIDVLEKLLHVHPIIQVIIDYRQLTKLYSTYIEGLQKEIFPDQKIHTIYHQALTQTGRLSSSAPNLQNIPVRLDEGRLIRKAFIPSQKDSVILSLDYSQIELRVLAHIAKAKEMIDAFNQDLDIHTKTAMDIFHVSQGEVTSLMRRQAKAINFGIVYGMSDFGLATQLDIPVKEAHDFIEKYFLTFPSIKQYMEDIVLFCKDKGYVETIFKRKRYIPAINDKNFMVQSGAKRLAMNTPIQGSAADLLKIAMIKVNQAMKEENVKSKLLLQVHDELVFEVPNEELDMMIRLVKDRMENAYALDVKIRADFAYGESWYDAK